MSRTSSVALVALVAFAACGGTDVRPESSPLSGPASSLAVVDADGWGGTWAQLEVRTATSQAPFIGEVMSVNRTVRLLRFAPQGADIVHVTGEICDVSVETSTSNETILPPAFVAALPAPDAVWDLGGDEAITRGEVVLGADPGIASVALPRSTNDPAMRDTDGDGHPGVTIRIEGLGGGEMYFAQRTSFELVADAISPVQIDGRVLWTADRRVLDATSRALRNARPSVPTDDPAQNYFRATRVFDGTTCADVEGSPELFAR